LGTGARLWLTMQQAYDLSQAEQRYGERVRAEVDAA
jgi:plasmid maintenance system antidote protein VapI